MGLERDSSHSSLPLNVLLHPSPRILLRSVSFFFFKGELVSSYSAAEKRGLRGYTSTASRSEPKRWAYFLVFFSFFPSLFVCTGGFFLCAGVVVVLEA